MACAGFVGRFLLTSLRGSPHRIPRGDVFAPGSGGVLRGMTRVVVVGEGLFWVGVLSGVALADWGVVSGRWVLPGRAGCPYGDDGVVGGLAGACWQGWLVTSGRDPPGFRGEVRLCAVRTVCSAE